METRGTPDGLAPQDESIEWLVTVAHEMRGTLQAVVLSAGMADHLIDQDTPTARSYVKRVLVHAMLLGRLVDDLVDSARAHELPCLPIDIDLVSLMRDLANLFEGLEAHRVQFALPERLLVFADAGRVRQIMRNLLSNAGKYSTPGLITISAEVRHQTVVVSVRDEGPGIGPLELKRLFGRRQRLSLEGDGLGVGLWLSRRLARAMGGDMWVTSEAGGPTTFYLALSAARGLGIPEAMVAGSGQSG